jgi:plastin-1
MEGAYDIPYETKKKFSAPEMNELINNFKAHDVDKSGKIEKAELKTIMVDLGHRETTEEDISKMLESVDIDSDNQLTIIEFLNLLANIKEVKGTDSIVTVTKTGKEVVEKTSGSYKHTYDVEERECFARVINQSLQTDEDCKEMLPIDPETDDLFKVVDDGIILCKLVNIAQPGTVDERVLNTKSNKTIFHIKENLNLALASIKGIGCKVIGIDDELIMKHTENIILGLLWQLIKIILVKDINLKHVPELARLVDEDNDEELSDLLKLPAEEILVRWVNYHLKNAKSDRKIKRIGKDMSDSIVYATVLHQLDNDCIDLASVKSEEDTNKRAKMVIEASNKFGINPLIGPSDILSGNTKLNTVFTADIFNHKHGLEELTKEEYEAAAMLDDDIEGSREERSYRMWVNSLGIEDVYVNNLYEEARDGLVFLKVMDRIQPGVVDWKRVEKKTGNNKFKKQINCAEVIECAKRMKCIIPGIESSQILNAKKKSILAIVWQIVKLHYMQLIGNDSEKDLVEWANKMIGKEENQVKSFKDKAIQNAKFLIHLCAALEPRAVNWEIVSDGDSEEDRMNNAKYAISIARKLGATIFCVWDDIVKVNHKMILVFVCALKDVHEEIKKKKKGGKSGEDTEEAKEETEEAKAE